MITRKHINITRLHLSLFLIAIFTGARLCAQTSAGTTDSLSKEKTTAISQAPYLKPIFKKLNALKQGDDKKINIVHIGDSHIQADFFTGALRKAFQKRYGDAGLGFSFPYRLVKTNGNKSIHYASNVKWRSKRNIFASEEDCVGLSGYSFQTGNPDFVLEIKAPDSAFSKLTIVSPHPENFALATAKKGYKFEEFRIKNTHHRIKSGETLSQIAEQHGVSTAAIKRKNGLHSAMIRAGKSLKIPQIVKSPRPIDKSEFNILKPEKGTSHTYKFPAGAPEKLYLIRADKKARYSLSALVAEKDKPGVVYHSIGVNGARFMDWNKTPLFFDQLKSLNPDFIIVSMGTNSAFDRLSTSEFNTDKEEFIHHLEQSVGSVPLLFTTPPPAMFNRRTPNEFSKKFSKKIMQTARRDDYAAWNLFRVMGGNKNLSANIKKHLMAGDRIHYTEKAYELMAEKFMDSWDSTLSVFALSKMSRK